LYEAVFEPGAAERTMWVVEENSQLYAFLVARFDGAECELENLVVLESHRRSGLGSQLMRSLIGLSRERSIQRILLEVRESNYAARALYEKLNFQPIGRRRGYYGQPPEDALLFALSL
jgi:ribosomal-protein-alanine N-acetyltransferase